MTDPEFLELEDVLDIHREQLARFGGRSGVRDAGLLDSAVATPRATFEGSFVHLDLFSMAAAYAFHIAENQPFHDGNKRTGLLCAVVFLEINGFIVEEPPLRLHDAMMAIAEGELDKRGMAELLRALSRPAERSGE